jgi:hypothetical protein
MWLILKAILILFVLVDMQIFHQCHNFLTIYFEIMYRINEVRKIGIGFGIVKLTLKSKLKESA